MCTQDFLNEIDYCLNRYSNRGKWKLPLGHWAGHIWRLADKSGRDGCGPYLDHGEHPFPDEDGLIRGTWPAEAFFGFPSLSHMERYCQPDTLRFMAEEGMWVHHILLPDYVVCGLLQLVFVGGVTVEKFPLSQLLSSGDLCAH